MKIGIISSWVETLSIFHFLTRYNNEYLIYCDQIWFPYWEKSLQYVLDRVQEAGDFLVKKWAEVVVVDPVYELALKYSGRQIWFKVLPLFQKYLQDFAFKNSLVGKLWIISDFWSFCEVQKLLEQEEKEYKPTGNQKMNKKFKYPFNYWVKLASSWIMNISDLWVHNPYLIRTMKNDLRYFKDAYVDTILPMHYNYFCMQRSIKSFFNFHKIRFYDFSVVEECFNKLVTESSWKYWVSVWINQSSNFLFRNKQLIWQMQRGKTEGVSVYMI